MLIQNDNISKDIEITEDFEMRGIFTGNVIVKKGAFLRLKGMACKSITVEPDARLEVTGMVNGSVVNNGGKVDVIGMVHQVIKNSGETIIAKSAVVNI